MSFEVSVYGVKTDAQSVPDLICIKRAALHVAAVTSALTSPAAALNVNHHAGEIN